MRILLTGGSGFIGQEFQEAFGNHYIITAPSHDEMDVTNEQQARKMVKEVEPEVVIHLAGLVSKEECEREPERAMRVNAEGTRIMAAVAAEYGAFFFYLSTDFVFAGDRSKPYAESDVPSPRNSYGRSKLQGEKYIREVCGDHSCLIVRTSRVFGKYGKNFISTLPQRMKNEPSIQLVHDCVSSFTYAPDLANAVENLLQTEAHGIIHLMNSGACSIWDFAHHIKSKLHLQTHLEKIRMDDFHEPAPLPRYTVLASEHSLEKYHPLRSWETALDEFLNTISQ